jgi:hypothetical protein
MSNRERDSDQISLLTPDRRGKLSRCYNKRTARKFDIRRIDLRESDAQTMFYYFSGQRNEGQTQQTLVMMSAVRPRLVRQSMQL